MSDELCRASLESSDADQVPSTADSGDHNCRFWAIISRQTPAVVIRAHLLDLPNSMKQMGAANDNGWGIGYYTRGESGPAILRGELAAIRDPSFDDAAWLAADAMPSVAVAHVRNCSSGLCQIPGPHPFLREFGGKEWLFGHNGTIDKAAIIGLLDAGFLAEHQPHNGTNVSEWIDSELFFLLILSTIEQKGWNVKLALVHVISSIRAAGAGHYFGLNFFLTDGAHVWAYRDGMDLSYVYDPTGSSCSAVASQPPTRTLGQWREVGERQLVVLRRYARPEIVDLTR